MRSGVKRVEPAIRERNALAGKLENDALSPDIGEPATPIPINARAITSARTLFDACAQAVTILPPVPAFYNHPQDINDIVDHIIARVLDQFGIEAKFARRWDGRMQGPRPIARVGQTLKGGEMSVGLAAIAALALRAHFNGG